MLGIILKGIQLVPAAVAAADDFRTMINSIGKTLSSEDQAELQAAYEDHISDSDDAHARFQARLAALAGE